MSKCCKGEGSHDECNVFFLVGAGERSSFVSHLSEAICKHGRAGQCCVNRKLLWANVNFLIIRHRRQKGHNGGNYTTLMCCEPVVIQLSSPPKPPSRVTLSTEASLWRTRDQWHGRDNTWLNYHVQSLQRNSSVMTVPHQLHNVYCHISEISYCLKIFRDDLYKIYGASESEVGITNNS